MKHSKHEEAASLAKLSKDELCQILLRLPLKTLGKCKLVSKLWNSLISNPEFAKAHLRFSNLNSDAPLFIAFQKYNTISSVMLGSSMNNMIINGDSCLIPLDEQFKLHSNRGYYVHFLVGSCDGIVCIFSKILGKSEDAMHLWNPTINKQKQISLPLEEGLTYLIVEYCWFGFVPSLNTYKIFLVYEVYQPAFVVRKYVYSSRDRKWREILETEDIGGKKGLYNQPRGVKSVVMNEALHYLIDSESIVKFDLVSETFERIPLSIKPDLLPRSFNMLLGAIGENKCLCVLVHHSEELVYDLWILEEYDKWDTWKKLCKLDLQMEIGRDHFFGFTHNGYLCVEEGQRLKLIDPSHYPPLYGNVNKCSSLVYQVTNHVESLVSPLFI